MDLPKDRIYVRHPPRHGAVLIVGAGVVGGFLADELAARGYSPLRLVDRDRLEEENLIRHPLGRPYLGQMKASALANHIREEAPWCNAIGTDADFLKLPTGQQLHLARQADVIVAAIESVDCRLRINELCLAAEKPAVYPAVWVGGGVREAEVGEIFWMRPGRQTPCYVCLRRWRAEAGEGRTGHGTQTDIKYHVLATTSVIDALLNPDDERAGILDAERNLILVHGFMPPSEAVQDFFDERSMQNVLVRFPETPCPACGGQRSTQAQQRGLGGQITEETAQALRRALDATVARLGKLVPLLGDGGPIAELNRRQAELERLVGQVASHSIEPELVRISAELDQVVGALPELEYVGQAMARLVEFSGKIREFDSQLGELDHKLSREKMAMERAVGVANELAVLRTQLNGTQSDMQSFRSDIRRVENEAVSLKPLLENLRNVASVLSYVQEYIILTREQRDEERRARMMRNPPPHSD